MLPTARSSPAVSELQMLFTPFRNNASVESIRSMSRRFPGFLLVCPPPPPGHLRRRPFGQRDTPAWHGHGAAAPRPHKKLIGVTFYELLCME